MAIYHNKFGYGRRSFSLHLLRPSDELPLSFTTTMGGDRGSTIAPGVIRKWGSVVCWVAQTHNREIGFEQGRKYHPMQGSINTSARYLVAQPAANGVFQFIISLYQPTYCFHPPFRQSGCESPQSYT